VLVAFAAAVIIGESYISRLPNHAGFFLVPVEDQVRVETERPRNTVVIVVDGLRLD
jgi:hypothetical protein